MCFTGAGVLISLAVGAASTAVSAVGAGTQAKAQEAQIEAQQAALDENARIERMLAQDALYRGQEEVKRHSLDVRRLLARQAVSSRGVDVTSEFFDRIYDDTDLFARLDSVVIMENARREAWGHQQAASGYETRSGALEEQVPYIRAAGSLNILSAGLHGVSAFQKAGFLPSGGDLDLFSAPESSYGSSADVQAVRPAWAQGLADDWITDWDWDPWD